MKYNTGYKTMTGESIRLGDKIKGLQSHEVVVLWSNKNKDFVVEIEDKRINYSDTLDNFMNAWNGFNSNSTIQKVGNILER